MMLQKEEKGGEIDRSKLCEKDADPLWDLKEEILEVLRSGPVCLSELSTIFNQPSKIILKALKEMEKAGVVEKRMYFEDDQDFQPWGIARPSFFRQKHPYSSRQ